MSFDYGHLNTGLSVRVTQQASDAVTVTVAGELDRQTSPEVERVIVELLRTRSPGRVALDMAELTFIGSDGLNALLTCRQHAEQANVTLEIDRAHRHVRQALAATDLVDVLMPTGGR